MSGAHEWKGTAETLKAKPTTTNTMASVTIGVASGPAMPALMPVNNVVPVTP